MWLMYSGHSGYEKINAFFINLINIRTNKTILFNQKKMFRYNITE